MLRQVVNQFRVQSSEFRVKDLFLCILSATLLIFSFPRLNIEFFAWFGFVPLFFALGKKSKCRAFLFSYITGIIFWAGIIYWLVHVTLVGTIILILYLALYFGFFGLIISTPNSELRTPNFLFIPSIWVLLEYVRGHLFTGFPWALLGYSQYLNLPVIQIADITGAWGVSFLVMMVNVVIWKFIQQVTGPRSQAQGHRSKTLGVALAYLSFIFCFLCVLAYGYYKLYLQPESCGPQPITASVIQGNIPQELKWRAEARDYILEKYTLLTEEASKANPGLVIWPEAANPDVGTRKINAFDEIASLAKKTKIPLLFGTVMEEGGQYFNSALLIDTTGKIVSRYDKLHLVPFGEYIPMRKIFPFLETVVPIGDITPGREYTIFEIPNPNGSSSLTMAFKRSRSANNFAVLICFEDLFPELSREFVKRGADFLVNITNDAWYKKTSAAQQHFQASVFRAVENHISVVRCANTGVSGFIGPSGKIISLVRDESKRNIFVDGYKTQEIDIIKLPISFYTLYGDVLILLLFIFTVFYGIFPFLRKI
jgi:apolipoprotein N-acyltransferase